MHALPLSGKCRDSGALEMRWACCERCTPDPDADDPVTSDADPNTSQCTMLAWLLSELLDPVAGSKSPARPAMAAGKANWSQAGSEPRGARSEGEIGRMPSGA